MNYHSLIITPPDYPHSACFVEVARSVDDALSAMGAYDPKGAPIVFGAHLERSIPEKAVVFNSEQVISWDYLQTLKGHRVWDYSQNNIALLAEKSIKAELCPIAYMPSMTCIASVSEEDIPVLMYGSQNERRMRIYHELKRAGVNARFAFNVYGEERDALIARAKIVLNVHFYEEAVFEIFRCAHLMANRKCVVSEIGKDMGLERPFYDAIWFCGYDGLVSVCRELLHDEERREAMKNKGFMGFRKTSMVDSLRDLI